jgi:hypothetical protein
MAQQRGGAARWRGGYGGRGGRGTAFISKAYVATVLEFMLEFIYIFRRSSLRSSACVVGKLGICH